ncbi:carcinoembryonic antigen-related cell adhesion molecule 5-like isoform X2 [Girardinichthys multiradiatus]|uniref:carcinoembryonic antigen-related cell adhesion molecule 5-like isoform X2 n=1 Tax=Girardinichthys multiradiatus TaxID=208333 RepID=UPI001FAE0795|nr:carcinoembryonic antigen-related cell adhesion molecule 5-like isoform X2 [Girardinichthys multiradiatus]
MESPSVFFLILTTLTFTDHVHNQRIHASVNPLPVGSNVTLSSDTNITLGSWMFNGSNLVFIYPGGYVLYKNRTERIISKSPSSLTITSARLTDSGLYKLEEINVFSVELELSVQEQISNATLSAKTTDLVEFIDTAVLMCSVSTGTSLSYKWLAGNSTISSGPRMQLSNGGATISIVGVTHYDQGPYRCNVSNGVGYDVSPPLTLNISYGPSNTTVKVMPDLYMHRSGSDITLSCSADSRPTATFQWMFNEVYLNRSSSKLDLQNIKENNSGIYKCVSYNPVTMRFNNNTREIRVMDPVTAVDIINNGGLAIVDKMFILQCEVTGPLVSIQWWKNDTPIAPDNRTVFGNKTLTLNPVQRSDDGLYKCYAVNLVSNMTSDPFAVEVNYGPEMPSITGPNVVKSGNTVTLRCWAISVPQSQYRWFFNGSLVSNKSEFMTPPLTKTMSGDYICMALNNITDKNSTASIKLTVIDPIQNVSIEELSNPAVEGNSHTLTCNIIGPADHIHWMKDGQPLYSDNRTVFSMNNRTVSFWPLKRSDSADYQCLAINAVGNMTSEPYRLFVTYGPENQVIKGPNKAKTGCIVTFTCKAVSDPPSEYKWFFNGSLVSNMSEYMTPSLRKEMSGKYICMAFNSMSWKNSTANITLTVIDPIYSVEIVPQINSARENDSYNLTCHVAGPADYIYWMKNGELLLADHRTVFSLYNKTVILQALRRFDNGQFQCMAINAVENKTSDPYTLLVSYGPDMPTINGTNRVNVGSNVTLSCYAPSVPPSLYRWYFHDSLVSNMSEYMTPVHTEDKGGEYTCMAINNITGKHSNASVLLTVIGPIKSVQIDTSKPHALENYSYNLTCRVTGVVDHIHWMKNWEKLLPDNNTVFSMDNKTVTFWPVDRYDAGRYRCMATNAVGNLTSEAYMLVVNYGPLNMNISGPESAKVGVPVSLTCSAVSQPECNFTWFLNNQSTPVGKGSILKFYANQSQTGKYQCTATNSVTNITMMQSKTFAIADHASASYIPNKEVLLLMGLYSLFAHLLFL